MRNLPLPYRGDQPVEKIDYLQLIKMSIIPVVGFAVITFLFVYVHSLIQRRSPIISSTDEERLRLEMQALAAKKIEGRRESGEPFIGEEKDTEESSSTGNGFIEGESL